MPTFTFDIPTKIVEIASPDTEATVQEIYDACVDFEETSAMLGHNRIVEAEGKFIVTTGQLLVITLFMLNGWRVQFEARAGPALEVCSISSGNFVGRTGNSKDDPESHPVAPTDNTHVTIEQAITGAMLQEDKIDYMAQVLLGRQKVREEGALMYMDTYDEAGTTVIFSQLLSDKIGDKPNMPSDVVWERGKT